MERKLHLLDSFSVQGADGHTYKVMGYEHLVSHAVLQDGQDHWEPTGQLEYRLASGELVSVAHDGSMRIASSGVELRRPQGTPASQARQVHQASKASQAATRH